MALSVLIVLSVAGAAQSYPGEETRIMVVYRSSDVKFEVMDILDAYSGKFIKEIEQGNLFVYSVPTMNLDLMNRDKQLGEVIEYFEIDRRVYADYVPNDSYWPLWNMEMIDVDHTWDVAQGDPSIIVAVLDTGCDYTHVDLAANVDETLGWDYVNNDNDPMDDTADGHGTMVCGIVCAEMDNNEGVVGVSQITLMPMKVLDSNGTGWTSDIVDAIYDAGNWGANVINMSFGSNWYSGSEATACDWAFNQMNIILAAAAGNEGTNRNHYPAAYEDVIGVGSVTSAGTRSTWSNTGDNVEIMAPGAWVRSTTPGDSYGYGLGTSFASPHVAGAAALAFSVRPTWENTRIRGILFNWADDMEAPGYDENTGYGLLDCWNQNGFLEFELEEE
jgi:subtilisin family serine protease